MIMVEWLESNLSIIEPNLAILEPEGLASQREAVEIFPMRNRSCWSCRSCSDTLFSYGNFGIREMREFIAHNTEIHLISVT